jgi:hypothetical protein
MTDYGTGALRHVQTQFSGNDVSLEEMLATRRKSAGVTPLMALVEYAHGLDLPDEIFGNQSIQEFQRIGTDLVLLHNDILSYKREEVCFLCLPRLTPNSLFLMLKFRIV